MLLRGVLALTAPLDLTPAVAPTPVGCSDASVAVLPVPLLTTFSSQPDLVKLKPVDTPMPISPNHRIFRCLGLAGPLVLFSLNSSAGPTRQSHTFVSSSSRNRRPCTHARTPLCRRRALALHCAAARARPHLSCAAAPQSLARPRRACATHAPPLTATDGLSTHAQPPLLRSASHAQAFKNDLIPPPFA